MNEIFKKILNWWNSQTPKYKKIFILGSFAVIILIILTTTMILRPNYKFFITGTSEQASGDLLRQLEEMSIKYRVSSGGTIYVNYKDVDALRMKLASDGVLGGNMRSYDLLSSQGFGATSYDKQVNYQIALEGELSRSISTIKGVRHARVHLVIPPRTYYTTTEENKATASVLVLMDTGAQLTTEQIRGIVNFVAGAVQGLEVREVKVVDNFSRDLTSSLFLDDQVGSAQSRLEMKKQVERYYSSKVQESLQSVFGFGNVVVISEINLDWTKLEQEERLVTPVNKTEGIILSQQQEIEESTSSGTAGAVGTDSNIPPYTYQSPENGDDFYRRSTTITNYDVNELYRRTVQDRTGEISDKSFTVFIDFINANIPENDTSRQQISNAISTAVGANMNSISVLSLQFNRDIENMRLEIEEEQVRRQKLMIFVFVLILTVVIVTFLVFLIVSYLRKRRTRLIIRARELELENRVKQEVSQLKEDKVEEFNPSKERQKQLEEIVDSRSEDVAEILKMWISAQ
jgi:flagellar M-ring protein FliF